MRPMSLIAVTAALLLGFAGAGTGLAGNETATAGDPAPEAEQEPPDPPLHRPNSKHPCKPGSGCEAVRGVAPLMMSEDGDFHFENDVHMEDGTTLTMENGSVFQVQEQATLLIPAESPRLFSGGVATFGTADDNPLRLVVDNETGLRLLPAPTPNVIGGNASNLVPDGVTGATIGGGGTDTAPNEVLASFGTVSGGSDNVASGVHAIVVGGEANTAAGQGSLAAGQGAGALHDGSFVWSDSSAAGIDSTGPDQFIVDASGGVGIGTDAPASALTVDGNVTPATNATYALGSPDLRWTDVWLSSVIHHSGDLEFENDAGVVTGTLSDTGNLTLPGKLSAAALEGDASNLTGVEADTLAEASVNSTAIADEEVQTADLANASVTAAKLGEACGQDQILKVDSTGAWVCAEDVDTTYDGTDFALSDQSCASGDVVAGVDANGNVVCVTDQDTDSDTLAELDCASTEITRYDGTAWVCGTDQDTTYTASTPIDLSGTDFTLSSADCTSGDHWAWNGSAWTCVQSGDVTAVTAGSGLDGGGTRGDVTLLVNTSETQARVTGACGPDASIASINEDGTVSCETDDDTTYIGGTGITVTSSDTIENDLGSSIESGEITDGTVDTADLAGDAVTTSEILDATIKKADLAQDGCADAEILKFDTGTNSWVCAVDEDTQTDTIPWTDVTDKPAGFGDDVDNDTLEGLACASSEIAKWNGSAWSCAVDEDSGGDITAVSAGTGLTGGGTSGDVSLAVDTTAIQERVTGACGTNASIDAINSDGTVSCEADDDTTYTAGTGLTLSGTEFSNDLGGSIESGEITDQTIAFEDLSRNGCNVGQVVKFSSTWWTCGADEDTTYSSGDGLELNDGVFEVRQDCNSAQILKVDNSATWSCASDADTTYDAGDGMELNNGSFELRQDCGSLEILKVHSDTKEWVCRNDRDTTYSAGDGLELDILEDTFKLRQDCSSDQLLLYNGTDWRCSGQVADADRLDGLDSSQFLRSDTDDTFASGGTLDIEGDLRIGPSSTSDRDRISFHDGTEYLQWEPKNLIFETSSGMEIGGDLAVGGPTTSDDDTITFDAGSESLRWDESAGEFVLSNDLKTGPRISFGSAEFIEDAGSNKIGTGTNSLNVGGTLTLGNGLVQVDTDQTMEFAMPSGASSEWFWRQGSDNEAMLDDLGNFKIDGSLSENAGVDVAEMFREAAPLEAGDLVALDGTEPDMVRPTQQAHDPDLIGVVSTKPGVLLGAAPLDAEEIEDVWGQEVLEQYRAQEDELTARVLAENPELATDLAANERDQGDPDPGAIEREEARRADKIEQKAIELFFEENFAPVALSGRVPVSVSVENGPIEAGDWLTASSTPGVAMKSTGEEPVVGKALESFNAGTGKIDALVAPGPHGADQGDVEERIEELDQQNEQLQQENQQLENEVSNLTERVEKLESIVNQLADEHEGVE